MLVTILWAMGFGIVMLLTIPVLAFLMIFRVIGGEKAYNQCTYHLTRIWSRIIILSTRSSVQVIGTENLVRHGKTCFVANHQSLLDIPLLLGWLGRPVGFIAKKELKKVPVISLWIMAIHSAFIDRSNPRKAIESVKKGSANIEKGYALVIFPEGTRTKTGRMGVFKAGSLKLATYAAAVIQPLTIKGTRNIYESTGRIKKSKVVLQIHNPVNPTDKVYQDKNELSSKLYEIINSAIY